MTVLRESRDGLEICIRLKPRASRTAVIGEKDGSLVCSVNSPPVDGKANEALIELLADWLDVPRKALSISSGSTSRDKKVLVTVPYVSVVKEKLK